MTIDNRTPFQVAQDDEASGRNATTGERYDGDFTTPIDDTTGERNDPPLRAQQREADDIDSDGGQQVVDNRPRADIEREEIAKRFKRKRIEDDGEVPYNGDPNDPENLYGKVARRQIEPEQGQDRLIGGVQEDIEPTQRQEQQPKLTKIVVRGKDVWLTNDQILERASKVEAADSYLEESRQLLTEAREIKRGARAAPGSQHPEDQTGAQDDGLNREAGEGDQHPDALVQAIEEIQYGDPKEAASKIRTVIAQASDESADKRQKSRLISNDVAKSQSELRAFMDKNPKLRDDEDANVMMEKYMYDIYREDMIQLGLKPEVLPKDNDELANWHRFYRVEGHNVRGTATALEDAKTRFTKKWSGESTGQGEQRQQQRRETQVDVNVDRTARRRNIPTQPTRAVSPRPDEQREAPQRQSRTDIIMGMRKQRGQPV